MNILIGENIKRLKKEKKVTQEKLAEVFNVTPAAVSKWENNETYPDITLLFPLSHFFGVTIDELMGYDYLAVEEEIKKVKSQIHDAWVIEKNWKKAKELTIEAKNKYPNDYEIMVKYLLYITGGQADNDPQVLIQNEKEILKTCDAILDGCDEENYRLEALTYKAKVLYAKKEEARAIELLNNFPSFYHTIGQKLEQLYPKGTKEFFNQLTLNINELSIFVGNKLGKYICYDASINSEEKIEKLVHLYDNIKTDNDLDVFNRIIKTAINEVRNRRNIIEFSDVQKERLEFFCNEINDIKI